MNVTVWRGGVFMEEIQDRPVPCVVYWGLRFIRVPIIEERLIKSVWRATLNTVPENDNNINNYDKNHTRGSTRTKLPSNTIISKNLAKTIIISSISSKILVCVFPFTNKSLKTGFSPNNDRKNPSQIKPQHQKTELNHSILILIWADLRQRDVVPKSCSIYTPALVVHLEFKLQK